MCDAVGLRSHNTVQSNNQYIVKHDRVIRDYDYRLTLQKCIIYELAMNHTFHVAFIDIFVELPLHSLPSGIMPKGNSFSYAHEHLHMHFQYDCSKSRDDLVE